MNYQDKTITGAEKNIRAQKKTSSLRDEIAQKAMQGLIENSPFSFNTLQENVGVRNQIATTAYDMADAMLNAREQ